MGLFSGAGSGGGGGGLNAAALAFAALYGKLVKDAAKKTEGGLTDIRQSKDQILTQHLYLLVLI